MYSRTHCWHEDLILVEEEMRWTIATGYWMAETWAAWATARTVDDDTLKEGLAVYAREHVKQELDTCMMLEVKWKGIRQKGQECLAGSLSVERCVEIELEGDAEPGEEDEDLEAGEMEREYGDEDDDDELM